MAQYFGDEQPPGYSPNDDGTSPPPYHPSVIKQWATRVISFSSEYNLTGYCANMILGAPKVYPRHGDIQGAWAQQLDGTFKDVYIEIEFEVEVRPTAIQIYETFNPGAVICIKGRPSSSTQWTNIWQRDGPEHLVTSRIFSPTLLIDSPHLRVRQIRIEMDLRASRNWCELDAVQLVGIRDGAAIKEPNDEHYTSDMENLVNNSMYSDVQLQLGDVRVAAHKAILATRSSFFKNNLRSEQLTIDLTSELPSLTTRDDMLTVLRYLYTGKLSNRLTASTYCAVTRASKVLNVPDMKTMALHHLAGSLLIKNVVDIYLSTDTQPNREEIQSLCISFMATHLQTMSKEKSFEKLPQSVLVTVVQEATRSIQLNSR